jgi:hypothetical protein
MQIIVGSSRTAGMALHPSIKKINVEVITKPGATYRMIGDQIEIHSRYHEGHPAVPGEGKKQYFILSGLCDLTHRVKEIEGKSRYEEVIFDKQPEAAMKHIRTEILNLRDRVLDLDALPIFCTICPKISGSTITTDLPKNIHTLSSMKHNMTLCK